MTQLKTLRTLKDLKCSLNDEISCCNGNKSKHYNPPSDTMMDSPHTRDSDLRQEAINWINRINERDFEYKADFPLGNGTWNNATLHDRAMIILWIKHFFNISEEDLK